MAPRTAEPTTTPLVITEQKAFSDLMRRVRKAGRVALDTEAASFHRYYDRIYLIQVSSTAETAIVDPLEITDPAPLGELLEDPSVEIVFHDADYDLRVLHRDYKFVATNVFDTRVAAQLLGEPGVGLGALLEKYFGVRLDKRMQRADWSRRPLTDEMIQYAAGDTTHLLDLRNLLESNLKEVGRLHWAQEEFARLQNLTWSPQNQDGNGFLRIKGAKALRPRELAVLRALYEWREKKAAEADRAPFRILGNDALISLSTAAPTDVGLLSKTKGVSETAARKHGAELVEAIQSALSLPSDQYPRIERPKRPKTDAAADAMFDRLKGLRNRRAKALGLEPGVMCPNGTLQAIARVSPRDEEELGKIRELRAWQIEGLGPADVLQAVTGSSPAE